MKWGVMRNKYAGVSTDGSKQAAYARAKQRLKDAKLNRKKNMKAFNKAYNDSTSLLNVLQFDKAANKRRDATLMDTAKKADSADRKYKAAKKAMKVAKKASKMEAKAVKNKYREEYMKGESKIGKIYAKLTNADKYYADMMYGLNKGKYKKSKK
jgi:hypothetical protein